MLKLIFIDKNHEARFRNMIEFMYSDIISKKNILSSIYLSTTNIELYLKFKKNFNHELGILNSELFLNSVTDNHLRELSNLVNTLYVKKIDWSVHLEHLSIEETRVYLRALKLVSEDEKDIC